MHTETRKHKSRNTKHAKDRLLQVVGLAVGVSGKSWARAWLSLRKQAGLNAEKDGGLQLAVAPGGGWLPQLMHTSELGDWLAHFVGSVAGHQPERSIGSHSLKATLL